MQLGLLKQEKKPKQQSNCFMTGNVTKKIIDTLKAKYEFRLNKGNQKMEYRKIGEAKYKYLNDTDFNSIKVELNLQDISCSRETLRTIIFSNQWPEYDPYKEFLENLPEWNGHDYVADLAATVRTDDNNYFLWCFRKWMVALVGSLAEEKVVNQTAIILCGTQGIGKSTWLMGLLPPELKEFSSSGFLQPKEKETLVQLSELCLYNMDEVENLKPANVEAIKEIMTKPSMYFRRAYATLSSNYPRRCSFCGTANGVNILHDITGNRRFLCHNVKSINYSMKDFDYNQLYAQLYHLFKTDFQYWFDKGEQKKVEKHNAQFKAISIEEELIMVYLEPCLDGDTGAKRMQAHEIQSFLQRKVPYVRISPVTIGKTLSAKGFKTKKSNGISKWVVKERNLNETEAKAQQTENSIS